MLVAWLIGKDARQSFVGSASYRATVTIASTNLFDMPLCTLGFRLSVLQDLTPYKKLFAAPGAGLYFSSQLVSLTGAAIFELGAIWFTLRTTQSPLITAIVAAAAFLPALMSPLAGLVSDAISPKRVVLATDLLRAVLVLGLGIYVLLARFPPALVIAVFSLVLGMLTRITIPARFAWLGDSVPDELLAHANALSSIISNLRLPVGGVVAALFVALDDPALIFIACGLFYLLSWALLLGLPNPSKSSLDESPSMPRRTGALKQAPTVLRDKRLSTSLTFVACSNILLVGAWIIGSPILA